MLRSLRWVFWLSATFALVWFSATVPLGDRPLFEHMRVIASTKEAKELATGTKERASDLVRRVRDKL